MLSRNSLYIAINVVDFNFCVYISFILNAQIRTRIRTFMRDCRLVVKFTLWPNSDLARGWIWFVAVEQRKRFNPKQNQHSNCMKKLETVKEMRNLKYEDFESLTWSWPVCEHLFYWKLRKKKKMHSYK